MSHLELWLTSGRGRPERYLIPVIRSREAGEEGRWVKERCVIGREGQMPDKPSISKCCPCLSQ